MDLHELYSRYAADVHRFALYLCGDPALADDVTSETFLRAWSSTSPIREATVKAYLFTIVRHLYLDEVGRRARQVEMSDGFSSPGPGQHEQLESGTALDRVLAALERLPEVDRAALLMRTYDDMPYEQIAQVLNISIAAAKVKVHRARLKLATLFPNGVHS